MRIWVHNINKKRENYGELESREDYFYSYFWMSQISFEELYELLRCYQLIILLYVLSFLRHYLNTKNNALMHEILLFCIVRSNADKPCLTVDMICN